MANPFVKTSVASITAGFTKTTAELHALITRLDVELTEHHDAITNLEARIEAALIEQDKAKVILSNINHLISKD